MELAPLARQRFFDANGAPLALGKLYTYSAGTDTPKATYANRAGSTLNANPVELDADGYADVWLTSGYYKFVLKDSNDVTQWTKDQIAVPYEAALASAFYRDVVYLTSADSPYTVTQEDNGKLISVDATSGAVIVNLPEISTVILPFNIAVKLTVATNSCTISRTGTDTIEGSTSKVLSTANAAAQFVGDTDKSPDQWAFIDQGTVADGGVTRVKMATGAVAVPNKASKSANYTVTTDDDEIYVSAACTITLLAANTSGARPVTIFNTSSTATVTVAPASGTILGFSSVYLAPKESATFHPDGSSTYYAS